MASFSPLCVRSPSPIVYIVEQFVEPLKAQDPLKGRASLTDYPAEVVAAFSDTFRTRVEQITIGDKATPRRKWNQRLFEVKRVRSIEQVPSVPRSGDIVLAFLYAPEKYFKDSSVSDQNEPDAVRALDEQWISAAWRVVYEWFHTKLVQKWESRLTSPKPPKGDSEIQPGNAGVSGVEYRGPFEAMLKAPGSQRVKVIYRRRVGLIDAGGVAGDALPVWSGRERVAMLKMLCDSADTPRLGPAAVNNVATKNLGGAAPKYLRALGWGLAYNLLHEFWHAARADGGHPLGTDGNLMIEQKPRATREGIVFDPSSIAAIQDHYIKTWCSDIVSKVSDIGTL